MAQPDRDERDAEALLGLPLAGRRLWGRTMVKLGWRPFLRQQVEYNLLVARQLEAIERATAEQTQRLASVEGRIADAEAAVQDVRSGHDHSIATVVQQVHSAIGLLRREFGELHLEVTRQSSTVQTTTDEVAELSQQVASELAAAAERTTRHLDDQHEALDKIERELDAVRGELGGALAASAWREAQIDQLLARARAAQPKLPAGDDLANVARSADLLELATVSLVHGDSAQSQELHRGDLQAVVDLQANGIAGPVIDVRCGRGEWLRQLADASVDAHGIDTNPLVVDRVTGAGLSASCADPIAELTLRPAGSVGVISAFWFFERLDAEHFVQFVDTVASRLRRGGLLLAVSADPRTPVGMARFYRDATALRPVHPEVLRHAVLSAGFASAEITDADPGDPRSAYRLVARR